MSEFRYGTCHRGRWLEELEPGFAWTDVGRPVCRRVKRPFRSHRATAKRIVACEGVRREGPADWPRDPVPEDPEDRGRGADRARQVSRARAGWTQPDSDVTVAELLDAYVPVAGWDFSTRKPTSATSAARSSPRSGIKEVRKVRGPLLDNLYTRLQQCGNLACAGKPFTEHRHVPGPYTWRSPQPRGRLRPRKRLDLRGPRPYRIPTSGFGAAVACQVAAMTLRAFSIVAGGAGSVAWPVS